MSIPASQIVQVNPGVLAAAGSAVDLNGLILTQSPFPPIGAVPGFANADDVGNYFGFASAEYEAAVIYFAGPDSATRTPGLLYFSQYAEEAVASFLRGGKLGLSLNALKALSGTLIVNSSGTPITSSSISLTAATSFSSAATIIQAAFTSPTFTVTYDAQHDAFLFTSNTTGAASTMDFATGTLSAGLNLTADFAAVVSPGADATTPAAAMSAILGVTQNWAAFTSAWEPSIDDKTAFSLWTSGQGDRFLYAGYDSDPNALVSGNTTTWGYAVKTALYDGIAPIYGDLTHASFVLGVVASIDFTRTNGRITFAFQKQADLLPSCSNASDASALIANGYNFYGAYATSNQDFNFLYPGSTPGQWKWLDSYCNQIWLNAQLQLALFTLLQSVGSIPYNAQGYALVDAAAQDPVNAAVNFGAIRTGVALSASQIAQIRNAVGTDVSQTLAAQGYYLQIAPASAGVRAARSSPACTLYYTDGGSIQSLNLASIEVQ